MQGLVTVFGGSGFVGAHVTRALAKRGVKVRVAVRRPERGFGLRLLGDVGQIEVVQANLRVPETVTRALAGAEACVNAAGVLAEAGPQRFQSVNATGARTLAEAAVAAGIRRLVHISALGADPEAAGGYARGKGLGEAAVRERAPGAVILRPSIAFGQNDRFFNALAQMVSRSPVAPLVGGGRGRAQPVFVGDIGAAAAASLLDPASEGKTYELGGPATYSFRALIELIGRETGHSPILAPLPLPLAALAGAVGDIASILPVPRPLTSDLVSLLRQDSVVAEGAPGLAALGVRAMALEALLPTYLYRYRKGGQYADAAATA